MTETTINPRITEILNSYNIPEKDGVAYLLSVYFETIPSYIPSTIIQKVNMSNILGYKNQEMVWNEPLFLVDEAKSDKWDWVVSDYMDMFGKVNPKRKGTASACKLRMKSFFAQNPEIRKEDILEATRMYIQNVSNPEYLVTSHYFIFKDKGVNRTSPLEEWVTKYLDFVKQIPVVPSETHVVNRMQ